MASPLPTRAPRHNGSSRMHLAQNRGCALFPPLLARSCGALPPAGQCSSFWLASVASMSTAAAASGEQLLAWVRAALAQAEARTGLPGFVAVKGRRKQMVKHLGHSVAQLLSKSARVSRRPEAASALFAAPPPTRCSSHARRPAADSPHTPKKLKPLPWVFASPRRASQSQLRRLPMNRAVPLRRVG